tara:strand:- start:163 stop:345 length:183 start_codon:yes stop_codon:yes gene_type:complete
MTHEEKVNFYYSLVDSCDLGPVVDALFNEINNELKNANVPDDVWQDVFDMVNDDYTIDNN